MRFCFNSMVCFVCAEFINFSACVVVLLMSLIVKVRRIQQLLYHP